MLERDEGALVTIFWIADFIRSHLTNQLMIHARHFLESGNPDILKTFWIPDRVGYDEQGAEFFYYLQESL